MQLVFCPRTLDGPIQYLSIHKTNLTVLEPYILIVNGYYPLQFIMIGFILLISDAPFLEAGIGNYLIRSKRSRWFLGQIAYILFLSVIYNIFLLLITTLPFIPYLRLSTNWSPLIQNFKEMRSLLLSLRDAGKLILLASHNPLDISLLCDSAFEIDRGMLFPFEITKSQNVVE